MDVLETTLDNESADGTKENGLTETEDQDTESMGVDYLKAEGSSGQQVTYRVLQVQGGDEQGLIAASLAPGTQVAQAVLQSPFSGGASGSGSPPQSDTTFAYIPTSGSGEPEAVLANHLTTSGGGQFYVMMSPQDVLQSQRNLAPRAGIVGVTGAIKEGRANRDDRRRATHNEVERRRRDKINNWIVALSKLVPDCSQETNKQGQIMSKGGILSKACEHIQDLRSANFQLAEKVKHSEQQCSENELLRQQLEQAKDENAYLRRVLEERGIDIAELQASGDH